MVDTRYRSDADEVMDDFSMEGEILRDALDKIASINKILGGNKVTLEGVRSLINKVEPGQEITILDVGCGNGDMLRTLADYAKRQGLNFKLHGIDANDYTIRHAISLSGDYPKISFSVQNILDFRLRDKYDIILCTLTLHHFKDPELLNLVRYFGERSRLGFVINDLHRSPLAYYLFRLICALFRLNDLSREDGLVSILRGFKASDLRAYSEALRFTNYSIKWKWAFRYQWIVRSI
ncbi:MAG: methyltransferase [Pedobacter sp.]|jgi:2-polyprenyl-3-methyl-5-hydroxy-6-metoxy-1,4-benzoquinol methylase|nr:methyltransferase [Pedobacter sp.]